MSHRPGLPGGQLPPPPQLRQFAFGRKARFPPGVRGCLSRAISYFGNGGCFVRDEGSLQLSPAERARIAQIGHLERAYGCN